MSKATHNGTCQVCGRVQAARKGDRLADHGYKVEWSQHVGACTGSRELPVELSVEILDATVASLRADAARLAAMTIDDIDRVEVRRRGMGLARRAAAPALVSLDELRAELAATWAKRTHVSADDAARYVENDIERARSERLRSLHWQGKMMVQHAEMLDERKARRYGKPLIERATRKLHKWAEGDLVKVDGKTFRIERKWSDWNGRGTRTNYRLEGVGHDGRRLVWSAQMLRNRATLIEAAGA